MDRLPSENEFSGTVKATLEEIKKTLGMVPNFFKVQAAVDPDWLELNWRHFKHVMLSPGGLDRKTRELIAFVVSEVNRCNYCSLAHETTALMAGATLLEIQQTRKIIELFCSFNSIADSFRIPCDITPDMVKKEI